MRKMIFPIVVFATLLIANSAFAELKNLYVKAESVGGCGATGQPTWQTATHIIASDNGFSVFGLTRDNIDAVRIKVKCQNCRLDNVKSDWNFYDPDANSWDSTIDLGGYYSKSGSTYYYRGEEKHEYCSEVFANNEWMMKFRWRYYGETKPKKQWAYKFTDYIIVI